MESLANTGLGFFISLALAYFVFPLFGMPKSLNSSFWIVVIFTISSIGRNYAIRRVFNLLHARKQDAH